MAIRTYFVILFPGTRHLFDEATPYNVALSYFHYGAGYFEKTLTLPYIEGALTLDEAKKEVLKPNATAQVAQPLETLRDSNSEIHSFLFVVEAEDDLRCKPESYSEATHVHDTLGSSMCCNDILRLVDAYLPPPEDRYDSFEEMVAEAEQLAEQDEEFRELEENDCQNPNSDRYWEAWWAEKEEEENVNDEG